MARLTVVHKLDDLDGSESHEVATLRFTFEGVDYEIDLNSHNAQKLRATLTDFIAVARPVKAPTTPVARSMINRANAASAQEIREWARLAGYYIAPQGLIPRDIREAYENNRPLPPPRTVPGCLTLRLPESRDVTLPRRDAPPRRRVTAS